ncbi:unnamed protein product [Caenorhabditis nigoni]
MGLDSLFEGFPPFPIPEAALLPPSFQLCNFHQVDPFIQTEAIFPSSASQNFIQEIQIKNTQEVQKMEVKQEKIKWNALIDECKQILNDVKKMDELLRDGGDQDDFLMGVKRSAAVFNRRQEIFILLFAEPASPEKDMVLKILSKVRNMDEGSFLGKALAAFDSDPNNPKFAALRKIREEKERSQKARELDAKNLILAFHLSNLEMAQKHWQQTVKKTHQCSDARTFLTNTSGTTFS